MTTYTDTQLKQALAKMLPEKIGDRRGAIRWLHDDQRRVLDTELLHLCWLVEKTLDIETGAHYGLILDCVCGNDYNSGAYKQNTGRKESATWQQRVTALSKLNE